MTGLPTQVTFVGDISEIRLNSDCCFNCGLFVPDKMTVHHAIPQRMKPERNILVPVCISCHQKINEVDRGAIHQFAHKLSRKMQELTSALPTFISQLKGK